MPVTDIAQINIRKSTAAQWSAANTLLAAGEFGLETDTKLMKLGDGVTLWNALGYQPEQIAAQIHLAISKATPADADEIPLSDSAATWGIKKLTWANLKATLKTYFDTLYSTIAGYTTTVSSATPIVLLVTSTRRQFITGSTAQTLTLPVASTMTTGNGFIVANNSSAITSVNSSGGNLVFAIAANTEVTVTCILASGTTAASWDAKITGQTTVATAVVVPVLTIVKPSANFTTTSTTFVDITGMTITRTPSSATNKIEIKMSVTLAVAASTPASFKVLAGATSLLEVGSYIPYNGANGSMVNLLFYIENNPTSSTIFKVQMKTDGTSCTIYGTAGGSACSMSTLEVY